MTSLISHQTYDWIIVGAGTAGCLLANRLSANPSHRVLLLEAGPKDSSPWIHMPLGYGRTFLNPKINWCYHTEPIPRLTNRTSFWPRGKVVGGSSSINGLVYQRGFADDFNHWAQMGLKQFAWDQVEPIFRSLEGFVGNGHETYGRDGPIRIHNRPNTPHPLCDVFYQAAAELDLPHLEHLNGPNPEGVGPYNFTVNQGRRISAATAFLHPILRQRQNLDLRHQHFATRCILDHQDDGQLRAKGVQTIHQGQTFEFNATKSVILCGGSINSPTLLMHSGIGPSNVLKQVDIPVKVANPHVGQHLKDHICQSHYFGCNRNSLNQELASIWKQCLLGIRYTLFRSGLLAGSVNQAGGFIRTGPDIDRADLQLYFNALTYLSRSQSNSKSSTILPDKQPRFSISYSLSRPHSEGHIRLQNADPLATPEIHPNYLGDIRDIETCLKGSQLLRKLSATNEMRNIITEEILPGPSVQAEEDLLADIKARIDTIFHPSGTCRMGVDRTESVVDENFDVHNVTGLKVVDASIFPDIPSANINAPTYLIAEMAAQQISRTHSTS